MRNPSLIAAILLSITIISASASTATQPNTSIIVILSSETIYPSGGLIIGGQTQPNESIAINVRNSGNLMTQTLATTSDGSGNFKIDLQNKEPLQPGVYTVEATAKNTKTYTKFTVLDENTRLCEDLEQKVAQVQSDAEAVYKMLDPLTALAKEMDARIQEGNSLYEKAKTLQASGNETGALEAYNASLQAFGEALHSNELISNSKPPSPDALLIMQLLEKIHQQNEAVINPSSPTSQDKSPLDSAKDLFAQAEKQLSEDDFNNLQWTLEKLASTMCEANAETQMISASTTLSQRLATYRSLYDGVLGLEKVLNAKFPNPPNPYPVLFDYILKLKDIFKIMDWMDAVISGKPYTPPEQVVTPVNQDRIKALDSEITDLETRVQTLAKSEQNPTVLSTIYKAWDLLKQTRLCDLDQNPDYAESLLVEAKSIIETIK